MTDNEIVKALECCTHGRCDDNCPFGGVREKCHKLDDFILDLINRQKAEIERLNKANTSVVEHLKKARRQLKTAKAEAIKEFAERLKERAYPLNFVLFMEINNLVKEMLSERGAK